MDTANMQKNRSKISYILLPVLLVIAVIFLWSLKTPPAPPFTEMQARSLVVSNWGDCTEDTCDELKVSILEQDGVRLVEAIYSGMRDDSVKAIKKIAPVKLVHDWWTIGTP